MPEMIFNRLAEIAGVSAVRAVIEHGKANIAAGHKGAVMSDPELDWQMSVVSNGVYFRLGEWGPYGLDDEQAARLLAVKEAN